MSGARRVWVTVAVAVVDCSRDIQKRLNIERSWDIEKNWGRK